MILQRINLLEKEREHFEKLLDKITSSFSFLFTNSNNVNILDSKSIPLLANSTKILGSLYWDNDTLAPRSLYSAINYLNSSIKSDENAYQSYSFLLDKIRSRNFTSIRSLINVSPARKAGSVLKYNSFYNSFYLISFEDLQLSSVSTFADLIDYTLEADTYIYVDNSETALSGRAVSDVTPFCIVTTATVFPETDWLQSLIIVDNSTSVIDLQISGPARLGHDILIHRKSTDFTVNINFEDLQLYEMGASFVFDGDYYGLTLSPHDTDTLFAHSFVQGF